MVLFGLGEDGKCLKYKFGKLFEGFPFHFIFVNISYNKLFPNEPCRRTTILCKPLTNSTVLKSIWNIDHNKGWESERPPLSAEGVSSPSSSSQPPLTRILITGCPGSGISHRGWAEQWSHSRLIHSARTQT